jgi:hypothetical protein
MSLRDAINEYLRSRIRFPSYPRALIWVHQLMASETQILVASDSFAADFLADRALLDPQDKGCCDAHRLAVDYVSRYQGECVNGIQN